MGLNKIYLDTCIVIYLVEKHADYASLITQRIHDHADAEFCFSHLTVFESLVIPLRNQNSELVSLFRKFFAKQTRLDLTEAVFESAAALRASHPSLRTPDALHLSAAKYHGCTEFWTHEPKLERVETALVNNILIN